MRRRRWRSSRPRPPVDRKAVGATVRGSASFNHSASTCPISRIAFEAATYRRPACIPQRDSDADSALRLPTKSQACSCRTSWRSEVSRRTRSRLPAVGDRRSRAGTASHRHGRRAPDIYERSSNATTSMRAAPTGGPRRSAAARHSSRSRERHLWRALRAIDAADRNSRNLRIPSRCRFAISERSPARLLRNPRKYTRF
jgi:hypothetical protein